MTQFTIQSKKFFPIKKIKETFLNVFLTYIMYLIESLKHKQILYKKKSI